MESSRRISNELELRLQAPDGAALRDQMVKQLRELEEDLEQRMRRMVHREEYQLLAASKDAARVAQLVLQPVSPRPQ